MSMLRLFLGLALIVPPVIAPEGADAQRRRDRLILRDARQVGRIVPIRQIERRVIPTMPGAQYLGFDFDMGSVVYTLKFLRDGNVIWVDVDGRSGAILGRTGR